MTRRATYKRQGVLAIRFWIKRRYHQNARIAATGLKTSTRNVRIVAHNGKVNNHAKGNYLLLDNDSYCLYPDVLLE